jgi:hypothetical protein
MPTLFTLSSRFRLKNDTTWHKVKVKVKYITHKRCWEPENTAWMTLRSLIFCVSFYYSNCDSGGGDDVSSEVLVMSVFSKHFSACLLTMSACLLVGLRDAYRLIGLVPKYLISTNKCWQSRVSAPSHYSLHTSHDTKTHASIFKCEISSVRKTGT